MFKFDVLGKSEIWIGYSVHFKLVIYDPEIAPRELSPDGKALFPGDDAIHLYAIETGKSHWVVRSMARKHMMSNQEYLQFVGKSENDVREELRGAANSYTNPINLAEVERERELAEKERERELAIDGSYIPIITSSYRGYDPSSGQYNQQISYYEYD